MRFRKLLTLAVVLLMTVGFSSASASIWQKKAARQKADPISGDWNASLVATGDGNSFKLTMKLKLENDRVTGSYESDHVGSGKISKGTWAANKLNLILETNHGPITLAGELKKGKLVGKFNSGPMQGTWQASKK